MAESIVKARVKTHIELKAYREQLEQRVEESRQALSISSKELEKKSEDLYKTDIALNVILEKKERAQYVLRQKILREIEILVFPHVEALEKEQQTPAQKLCIDAIKSQLNSLKSSSAIDINSIRHKLSPTELKIAHWIKEGKSTKEISKLTKLVEKTVYWHRNNIREKLGLSNQKLSLRAYLITIEEPD